jgi:hypothetical protein
VLMQEGRRIAADVMDAWLRLIDGDLPPGAIGEVNVVRTPRHDRDDGAQRAAAPRGTNLEELRPQGEPPRLAEASPQSTSPAGPRGAAEDGAIHVSWSGPGLIVLTAPTPLPLQQDHVAARFGSEGDGLVVFRDDAAGVGGSMPRLDYLATTRRMSFTGPTADSVRVEFDGTGAMIAGRIDSDLGTGFIKVPGQVRIEQGEGGADRPFSITAQERSAFMLSMLDGALTSELEQATFTGDVRLESPDGEATAGFARGEFRTLAGRANNLVRLVLEESATMRAAGDGRIAGDRVDVAFRTVAPDGGGSPRPQPERVTITGNAMALRGTQQIESEFLEGQIGIQNGRPAQLASAVARGSARFTDVADGLEATSDELRYATEVNEREVQEVNLTGQVQIVHTEGEAVSRIRGTHVRLNGLAKTMEVMGRGQFNHTEAGEERLTATWSRSMWFDDGLGVVRCEGDAEAISTPDPLTRERAAGQRISLNLTAARNEEGGSMRREVARAEVFGADAAGERALFESRRFAADAGVPEGRRLEQLVYLEGARIDADNAGGTLLVPSAGRLLLLDHRADRTGTESPTAEGVPAAIDAPGTGMGRGSSLFNWEQSMRFDRTTGLMEMIRGVDGTHRRLEDGEITAISCDGLTVRTTPAPAGTGLAGGDGLELLSARAVGSVHLSTGPARSPGQPLPARQELTADIVEYDAQRGTVEARATEGNIVTLIDPSLPVPTTARALWWDMVRETIRITEPAPVVAPR